MRGKTLVFMLITIFIFQQSAAVWGRQAPAEAAVSIPAPAFVPAAGVTYRVIPLGTLDGDESRAFGLNDAGVVVGDYFIPHPDPRIGLGEYRAFRWEDSDGDNQTDSGEMIDLGDLGGDESSAIDVNPSGQIVGSSLTGELVGGSHSESHGFLWQSGNMADLGISPCYQICNPHAINSAGQVAGETMVDDTGQTRGFLYQGGTTLIGTFGGQASQARGINDAGQVAGFAQEGSGWPMAFLYDSGTLINLGALGGYASQAFGINNAGQVVGFVDRLDLPRQAFLFEDLNANRQADPGEMIDLGALNGASTTALAINDLGQVIGRAGSGQTWLWQDLNHNWVSDPGEMQNLHDLLDPNYSGWQITQVHDINNKGMIAGVGRLASGNEVAVLLKPFKPWTVMVYIAGDNDLSSSYLPIFNRLEMVADNPNVNVVVLLDQAAAGDSAYYHVQFDEEFGPFATYTEGEDYWPQGELDTGDFTNLVDFVQWAREEFPADRYALLLSDHGSGLGGGMMDDPAENSMTIMEMGQALDQIAVDGRIDVLYMDMCLMAMIEDAYQFRNAADYYVASEEIQWALDEPYMGYINGIDAHTTPAQLAFQFADAYAQAAQLDGDYYTISAADMAGLFPLVSATNSLADALDVEMEAISTTLTTVLADVQRFDMNDDDSLTVEDAYIDLYDFARLLSEEAGFPAVQSSAESVMGAVEQYILYHNNGSQPDFDLSRSHGVSIFFPEIASSFYDADQYAFAVGADWADSHRISSLAADTVSWGPMLVKYFLTTQPGGPDDPNPPVPISRRLAQFNLYIPSILR